LKILVVTTDIDHVEPYQFTGMLARGAEVRVICAHDAINLSLFKQNHVTVDKIHYHGWRSRENIGQIEKQVQQFKPDIVHVLRKKALLNTIPALKNSSAPLLAYRGIVGNLSFLDPKSLLSFLHPRVDKLVCVAEAVRQHFLRMGWGPVYLQHEKVVTIHKGHPVEHYEHVEPANLSEYGVPEDLKVISFCGSMRPRKGGATLINAFSNLRTENTALLLVGDVRDPLAQAALDKSPRRDRIFQTGRVSQNEALSIARSIDVTTMPSTKREGLPRALIEAMIQGVPAVVTDVGGSPELIEEGRSGMVVPPHDVEAFRQALDHVLEDQNLVSMGEAARARVRDKFDVKETVQRNWDVYTELLTES